VPLLAVGLLYAKNAVLFGVPTTSSWMGMNLAHETVSKLDPAKRTQLVAQGSLHRVSLIEPFSPLSAYTNTVPLAARTGIPILDEPVKAGGARTRYGSRTNYNSKTYIAISRSYLSDAVWVIHHDPSVYLGSVAEGLQTSMRPSTEYRFIYNSRFQIITYASFVERYVYLRRSPDGIGYGILAAYLFAAAYLTVLIAQLARRTRKPDPALITILFLGLTVLYAYGVSSLTEVGENQRMRFFLDPFVLVVVVHGLRTVALRLPTRYEATTRVRSLLHRRPEPRTAIQ
jgi:hypothetical protein